VSIPTQLWFNRSIKIFLGGLSSGTTARSADVQHVVGKRLPEPVCVEEATKCGQ